MKGLISSICYLSLLILALAMIQPAQAGSLLGGHITWDSTGKDTFEVKVVVYKDCSKQSSAVPPDLKVGCRTGRLSGAKTTLLSYNGGKTITSTCDSVCAQCQSPSCSFANSVEKHVATYLVALDKVSCCKIRFSHQGGKRSSRLENGLANDSLYLESWINHCVAGCRTENSVQFQKDFSPIICKGQPVRKDLEFSGVILLIRSVIIGLSPNQPGKIRPTSRVISGMIVHSFLELSLTIIFLRR
jgi:hypothetical protein